MTEPPNQQEKEKKRAMPKQQPPVTNTNANSAVMPLQSSPSNASPSLSSSTASSSPSPASSPSPTPEPSPAAPSPSPVQVSPSEQKKSASQKPAKKEETVARGISLPLSKKHCMYLCNFIRHKSVDAALADLELVLKFKRAVPMKGEIPHRHGMMSGRYPVKAAKLFMKLLKGLKGNIAVSGLDTAKTSIVWASASWASRPQKRGGARFKRTHVVLKAREAASVKQEKPMREKTEKQEEKK